MIDAAKAPREFDVYPGFDGKRTISKTRNTRLQRLVGHRQLDIPLWPRRQPARWLRPRLLALSIFPFVRASYRIRVRGRANLAAISEPCLIISTHNLHMDQSVVLLALPYRFRQRVAIAAAAQDIYGNRLRGFLASLLGNGFPFNRDGSGIRQSLGTVARTLADGWHVLIFPEGKLTPVGPMQPFRSGSGFLAVETGAPVLPVRIDVVRRSFMEGSRFPSWRGEVVVHIGPPLVFDEGTPPAIVTAALERAVRDA